MTSEKRQISDPARDLLRAINLLAPMAGQQPVWQAMASILDVQPWGDRFMLALRLVSRTIQDVEDSMVSDASTDESDRQFFAERIGTLRKWLSLEGLSNGWQHVGRFNGPLGSETTTFLQSTSRTMRAKNDYFHPTSEDVAKLLEALDEIVQSFEGVTLERHDVIREALVRGASDTRFVLQKIEFFGYSRVVGPAAEMLAILRTLASLDRGKSERVNWKRVGSAAKRFYGLLVELERAKKVFQMVEDGSSTALRLLGLN